MISNPQLVGRHSVSLAEVTSPAGDWVKVRVMVGQGTVTVSNRQGQTVANRPGLVDVLTDPAVRRAWTFVFDNGDVWSVRRQKGCGCGGG